MILPFGISNAPASSQGYVQKILAKKLEIFVIVLRDILEYIKDQSQGDVEVVRSDLGLFPRQDRGCQDQPEPKSVQNIPVLIGVAYSYCFSGLRKNCRPTYVNAQVKFISRVINSRAC